MVLLIAHYHLRPGGIRRVIELAAPLLVRGLKPPISAVWLLTGEAPDPAWHAQLERSLFPCPVRLHLEPALNYASEQRRPAPLIARRIRAFLENLHPRLNLQPAAVWAHNLGLARNPALATELTRFCSQHRLPLVAHHHDWWFDNRWQRWPDLQAAGIRSLPRVAEALFPASAWVRHAAINRADLAPLANDPGRTTAWLPNPVMPAPAVSPARTTTARRWLTRRLRHAGPVWIVPCRFLRRKNLAEALLLTRWLNPKAALVTTGAPSSTDEIPCARRLAEAARNAGWPFHPSVLADAPRSAPSVAELMAASDAVLFTSIQEGFGLPYLEAVTAARPLLARTLPNIAPDLDRLGFRFPQLYQDILVDPGLFDAPAEHRRQRDRFRLWRHKLPRDARALVETPPWLDTAALASPIPFSRLTLTAQIEVLHQPLDASWNRAALLNPWLADWKHRVATGTLGLRPWPPSAERWLGAAGYARRFQHLLRPPASSPSPSQPADRVLRDYLRSRLAATNLFPLLWTSRP